MLLLLPQVCKNQQLRILAASIFKQFTSFLLQFWVRVSIDV